ncbi:hypothetical protein [Paraburkholderia xenovorans]
MVITWRQRSTDRLIPVNVSPSYVRAASLTIASNIAGAPDTGQDRFEDTTADGKYAVPGSQRAIARGDPGRDVALASQMLVQYSELARKKWIPC